MRWEHAERLVRQARRPVITAHEFPDGDAVGAEVALAEILRELGADPLVLNAQKEPGIYSFLCREGEPVVFAPERETELLRDADLLVVLDANDWDRTGPVGAAMAGINAPSLCIDHHASESTFATVNVVDSQASSTCELVYDFAEHLDVKRSRRFNEAVYAGILFDTGNFRFGNTSARIHRIAADLLDDGIVVEEMFQRIFESGSLERMRLFGMALATLRSESDIRLAWFTVTSQMLEESGAEPEEVEGFVDMVRTIRDADLVFMFRDAPDGKVKGSFRSKKDAYDVNCLAEQFGGGGHLRASGATLEGPIASASMTVVEAAKRMFAGRP